MLSLDLLSDLRVEALTRYGVGHPAAQLDESWK